MPPPFQWESFHDQHPYPHHRIHKHAGAARPAWRFSAAAPDSPPPDVEEGLAAVSDIGTCLRDFLNAALRDYI